MKKLVFSSLLMLSAGIASAQLGLGTNSPNQSAVLDLASETKGFLPPRMTESQRTNIGSPTPGLLVYQTDNTGTSTEGLYVYTGTGWIKTNTSTINRNSTLVGDGTSGSPLGLNTANSNLWTANQTFGGTFLITSNSRIAMTNNDNLARDIRLQEPSGSGTQFVGFEAPPVSQNTRYVFPPAVGPVGSALTVSNTFPGNDNSTDKTNLVWSASMPPSGAAGGDLTGTYPNPTIANSAITSGKIASGAVTPAKISSSGAATGNVLTYDGANVTWAAPATSSSAFGDIETQSISGSTPSVTVTNTNARLILMDRNGEVVANVNTGTNNPSKLSITIPSASSYTKGTVLKFVMTNTAGGVNPSGVVYLTSPGSSVVARLTSSSGSTSTERNLTAASVNSLDLMSDGVSTWYVLP